MLNTNNNSNLTQEQLEQLIEGYFDCSISEADEELLRRELTHCRWSSPAIDEAKATMLLFAEGANRRKQAQRKRSGPIWLKVASVAAVIAVAVTIGVRIMAGISAQGVCEAYVGGHKIAEGDEVMSLISSDISSVSQASCEVASSIDQQMRDIPL